MKYSIFRYAVLLLILLGALPGLASCGEENSGRDSGKDEKERFEDIFPEKTDTGSTDTEEKDGPSFTFPFDLGTDKEPEGAPPSEKRIVRELQDNPFFLDNTDVTITDYEIIKRRTDEADHSDLVYIRVKAANDRFAWDRSYLMTYGLYNEGWILDEVAEYERSGWTIKALQGVKEETLEEYKEYIKEEYGYESVEMKSRETDLETGSGRETVIYEATVEHPFSTEVKELEVRWYFSDRSYDYTSDTPYQIDRTVFINDNIIGLHWYGSVNNNNISYKFIVEDLTEEELIFNVTQYVTGLGNYYYEPVSGKWSCSSLTYFTGTGDDESVGIYLPGFSSVYLRYDDFGRNSYLMIDLDSGEGYFTKVYLDYASSAVEKNIFTGKTALEEATECAVQAAQDNGLASYDAENPMCGVWAWNSDDADFADSVWCLYPDGRCEIYRYEDLIGVYLANELMWQTDENRGQIILTDSDVETETMTLSITWYSDDTFAFEEYEIYNHYAVANRVFYS